MAKPDQTWQKLDEKQPAPREKQSPKDKLLKTPEEKLAVYKDNLSKPKEHKLAAYKDKLSRPLSAQQNTAGKAADGRKARPGSATTTNRRPLSGNALEKEKGFMAPKGVDKMANILETINGLQQQSDLRIKDYDALKVTLVEAQNERDELRQQCKELQSELELQRVELERAEVSREALSRELNDVRCREWLKATSGRSTVLANTEGESSPRKQEVLAKVTEKESGEENAALDLPETPEAQEGEQQQEKEGDQKYEDDFEEDVEEEEMDQDQDRDSRLADTKESPTAGTQTEETLPLEGFSASTPEVFLEQACVQLKRDLEKSETALAEAKREIQELKDNAEKDKPIRSNTPKPKMERMRSSASEDGYNSSGERKDDVGKKKTTGASTDAQLRAAQSQVKRLETQLKNLQEDKAKTTKMNEKKLANLEQKNAGLEFQVSELQTQLKAAVAEEKERKELEKELEEARAAVQDLNLKMEEAAALRGALERNSDVRQLSLQTDLESERQLAARELASCREAHGAELAEVNRKLMEEVEERERLEEELERLKEEVTAVSSASESHSQQAIQAAEQLAAAQARVQSLQTALKVQTQDVEKCREKEKGEQARLQALKDEYAEKETQLMAKSEAAQQTAVALEVEIHTLTEARAKAEEKLKSESAALEEARAVMALACADVQRLTTEAHETGAELERERAAAAELKAANQQAAESASAAESAWGAERARLEEQTANLQAQIQTMQSGRGEVEAEVAMAKGAAKMAENALQTLQGKQAANDRLLKKAQTALKESQAAQEEAVKQAQEAQRNMQAKDAELAREVANGKKARLERKEAKALLEAATAQRTQIEQELNVAKLELESEKAENVRLKEEVDLERTEAEREVRERLQAEMASERQLAAEENARLIKEVEVEHAQLLSQAESDHQAALSEARTELTQAHAATEALSNQLADANANSKQTRSELAEANSNSARMHAELVSLTLQLSEREKAPEAAMPSSAPTVASTADLRLQVQNDELKTKLKEAEAQLRELQEEKRHVALLVQGKDAHVALEQTARKEDAAQIAKLSQDLEHMRSQLSAAAAGVVMNQSGEQGLSGPVISTSPSTSQAQGSGEESGGASTIATPSVYSDVQVKAQVEELERKVRVQTELNSEKDQRIAGLTQFLKEKDDRISFLSVSASESAARAERLNQQLQSVSENSVGGVGGHAVLDPKLEEERTMLQAALSRATNAETEEATARSRAEVAEKQLTVLKQKGREKDEVIAKLFLQKSSLEQRIKQLQDGSDSPQSVQSLTMEIERLEREKENSNAEVVLLRKEKQNRTWSGQTTGKPTKGNNSATTQDQVTVKDLKTANQLLHAVSQRFQIPLESKEGGGGASSSSNVGVKDLLTSVTEVLRRLDTTPGADMAVYMAASRHDARNQTTGRIEGERGLYYPASTVAEASNWGVSLPQISHTNPGKVNKNRVNVRNDVIHGAPKAKPGQQPGQKVVFLK